MDKELKKIMNDLYDYCKKSNLPYLSLSVVDKDDSCMVMAHNTDKYTPYISEFMRKEAF